MKDRSYLEQRTKARRQGSDTALDPLGHRPQTVELTVTTEWSGKTASERWRAFDGLAPPQVYPAGTELFHQGARIEDLYWIEQGIVKLTRVHDDGREMIMGLYSPGWVPGATAAILQLPAPATALTITRCHVRRMRAEEFRHRVELTDEFLWYIIQMVSREAYEQALHHAAVGLLAARERLEQFLWEFASAIEPAEPKKEIGLQLLLKQWELAELIAVTPEHLSRILNQMEREGIIRRQKGWLIVIDPQRLRDGPEF